MNRKRMLIFLISAICLITTVTYIDISNEEDMTEATHITAENTLYTDISELYEPNINYMLLMINAVVKGNHEALPELISKRNNKLTDNGLESEIISAEEFLKNFSKYAGFETDIDYTLEMVQACIEKDVEKGREAEKSRNNKINAICPDEKKISFDELYMLSKIITAEAGSSWLPREWKIMVGEVLLNRVESPEYPSTLEECVYQKGQYSCVIKGTYDDIAPKEDCVLAALELLKGERILKDKSVVFQASFKQGGGIHTKLRDKILGNTYLCYSSRRELYE